MNPPTLAYPEASRGVGERKRYGLFLLRIEESPQLAAASFNTRLFQYLDWLERTFMWNENMGSGLHMSRLLS